MMATNLETPSPLDVAYYEWLVGQIKVPRRKGKRYGQLFELMHNTEFHWFVDLDAARWGDGNQLRYDYFRFELESKYHKGLMGPPFISFLEVLVALSKRVSWVMDGPGTEPYWAWRLIKNLRLHNMADPLSDRQRQQVCEILHNCIWRDYDPSGEGGFFPMEHTTRDQRKVDIWMQMQEWAMELDPII
jgi:hypothetical protein